LKTDLGVGRTLSHLKSDLEVTRSGIGSEPLENGPWSESGVGPFDWHIGVDLALAPNYAHTDVTPWRRPLYSQDKAFDEDVLVRSTLIEARLKDLTCVGGGKVPNYLMGHCPIGLRRGRCLKAKLRNGCHDLRVSSSRKSGERRGFAWLCKCCSLGMIETTEHFVCDCPAFNSLRNEFWEDASGIVPGFSELSSVEKLDCLLKDDAPARLRLRSYRFFMKMFDARSLVSK